MHTESTFDSLLEALLPKVQDEPSGLFEQAKECVIVGARVFRDIESKPSKLGIAYAIYLHELPESELESLDTRWCVGLVERFCDDPFLCLSAANVLSQQGQYLGAVAMFRLSLHNLEQANCPRPPPSVNCRGKGTEGLEISLKLFRQQMEFPVVPWSSIVVDSDSATRLLECAYQFLRDKVFAPHTVVGILHERGSNAPWAMNDIFELATHLQAEFSVSGCAEVVTLLEEMALRLPPPELKSVISYHHGKYPTAHVLSRWLKENALAQPDSKFTISREHHVDGYRFALKTKKRSDDSDRRSD